MSRQQSREYDETKRQIEEDADREILDIKNNYERRLRDEKEMNVRLKGEAGIMRKKVRTVPPFIIDVVLSGQIINFMCERLIPHVNKYE